jgi:ADP-heptose:LPS heptosyltransferase
MNLISRLFFKIVPRIRWPFQTGRLLIIRLDEIGDYILFRNFLETLRRDERWKRYQITLLGNKNFREIAETLDRRYVDEFIWIDAEKLTGAYFLLLVAKLKLRGFDVAINPIHARGTLYENLLFLSGSKYVIGSSGEYELAEKIFTDDDYDQLIQVPDHSHFEFYRNQAFFKALPTRYDATLVLPFKKSQHIDPSRVNIVVFPGAGDAFRRWPPSSFASLIGAIQKTSPVIRFIIAGTSNDARLASEITGGINFPVLDLTGKTSLIELIDLIGSCRLLISNETSAVDIAAATGAPAICISNGNHFRRFNPYPPELTNKIVTVYPTDRFYSKDDREIDALAEACRIRSDFDIGLVSVTAVLEAFRKLSVNSFL